MCIKRISLAALCFLSALTAHSAGETVSTNMGLIIPGVGVTIGPTWASDINTSLGLIDLHDHSSGKGVQITPSGINISSDLVFNTHNATTLRAVRFSSQSSPITGVSPDIGELYESGTDLYFNDGSGNQVRITQSGSVAGSAGTITGLPSGTASAAYSGGSGTFVFQQSTSTAANLDVGTLILRYPGSYPAPAGNYIALQAPTTLATGFSWTLPATEPAASNAIPAITTAGVISYINIDNSTLQISSATLKVPTGGITATQIASATITGTQIASSVNLPGNAVQENAKNVVVSNTNATKSLSIVRGQVASGGSVAAGEGFTVSRTGSPTYTYTITWTTAFTDAPSVTVGPQTSSGYSVVVQTTSTTTATINFVDNTGTVQPSDFYFIAVGQRQ